MAAAEDVFGLVGCEFDQLRFDLAVDQGGFGIIYRGHHTGLDEPVAIKCLRLDQKLTPALATQFRDRFRDETKIAYRLSQGNLDIVRSITSGTLKSPKTGAMIPYMALEWLEGHTLTHELKTRGGKPMTVEEVVNLLDPAAGAIAYAHEQGVVHRDIKPANLFLTRTRQGRRLKVLDFGLAKALHVDAIVSPAEHTQSGFFICSPSYGAPELFIKSLGAISPQTDVYSFALVFLEMLAGRKVRPAKGMADAIMAVSEERTCSPNAETLGLTIPAAIDKVLRRAVARHVSGRPENLGVFWGELRDAMLQVDSHADLMQTIANDALPAMNLVRQAIRRADEQRRAGLAPPPQPPRPADRPPLPEPTSRRPEIPVYATSPESATSPMGHQVSSPPTPRLADSPLPAQPQSPGIDLSRTLPLNSPLVSPDLRAAMASAVRTAPLVRAPSGTFSAPLTGPVQPSSGQMMQSGAFPSQIGPSPMASTTGPQGWTAPPGDVSWQLQTQSSKLVPRPLSKSPGFLFVLFLVLCAAGAGAVFGWRRLR